MLGSLYKKISKEFSQNMLIGDFYELLTKHLEDFYAEKTRYIWEFQTDEINNGFSLYLYIDYKFTDISVLVSDCSFYDFWNEEINHLDNFKMFLNNCGAALKQWYSISEPVFPKPPFDEILSETLSTMYNNTIKKEWHYASKEFAYRDFEDFSDNHTFFTSTILWDLNGLVFYFRNFRVVFGIREAEDITELQIIMSAKGVEVDFVIFDVEFINYHEDILGHQIEEFVISILKEVERRLIEWNGGVINVSKARKLLT